jgi:hypothetical protein
MWSAATTWFTRSHLPHFSPVDSVCTMGTVPRNTLSMSTTFQSSHTRLLHAGIILRTTPGARVQRAHGIHGPVTSAGLPCPRYE